jgi:DNA-binding protein HU-beta
VPLILLSDQENYPDVNIPEIQKIPARGIKEMAMNKGDLVEKVAQDCGLSKAAAEQALNSVLGSISDALAAGDKVTLVGFGTFSVSQRAAREGRNPQTGKTINIPARKVVKFKAGSKLADAAK